MARALSIYLPDWPIWLARRKRTSKPKNAQPSATKRPECWLLWSSDRGAQFIASACVRARAAGVLPGMTLAQARLLCGNFSIQDQPANPDGDAASLRRLAQALLRYAPVSAPDGPDGILLDISGCGRLFGGEAAHVAKFASTFKRWKLRARLAVAPTYTCAAALARYGEAPIACVLEKTIRSAVATLPVAALRLDKKSLARLTDVGITHVSDLFGLERGELVTRFGSQFLVQLDRLTGTATDSIESVRCERTYTATHTFDGPIKRLAIVEAMTRRLLDQLIDDLLSNQRGLIELTVEFKRVDCPAALVTLNLSYPTVNCAHLWKLLAPKLERVHLGFGVTEIHFVAAKTDRVEPDQATFLRTSKSEALSSPALGALLDSLTERLGNDAVLVAAVQESHVPEDAFRFRPAREALDDTARKNAKTPSAFNAAYRPSQLFEVAEPIKVISLVPDGPPRWLEWRGHARNILWSIGPERIAAPWWGRDLGRTRDYYEIEDERGERLWVYRDSAEGAWFVHGRWA